MSKQRTTIYLVTNHYNVPDTCQDMDEATKKARELLTKKGVVCVTAHVYANHVLKEQKKMTQKKPYWH